jgi:predicted phage tail protein
LAWNDNSYNEFGFRIERKTGVTGTYTQIATVGPDVTSYTDPNLAPATIYFYRVRAFNQKGNSSFSNEASGMATTTSGGSAAMEGA